MNPAHFFASRMATKGSKDFLFSADPTRPHRHGVRLAGVTAACCAQLASDGALQDHHIALVKHATRHGMKPKFRKVAKVALVLLLSKA